MLTLCVREVVCCRVNLRLPKPPDKRGMASTVRLSTHCPSYSTSSAAYTRCSPRCCPCPTPLPTMYPMPRENPTDIAVDEMNIAHIFCEAALPVADLCTKTFCHRCHILFLFDLDWLLCTVPSLYSFSLCIWLSSPTPQISRPRSIGVGLQIILATTMITVAMITALSVPFTLKDLWIPRKATKPVIK